MENHFQNPGHETQDQHIERGFEMIYIEQLIEQLKHPDSGVRKYAACKLANFKQESAIPELLRILNDPDSIDSDIKDVFRSLATIGSRRFAKILINKLRHSRHLVYHKLYDAFTILIDPRAIPELIEGLKSEFYPIRFHCTMTL